MFGQGAGARLGFRAAARVVGGFCLCVVTATSSCAESHEESTADNSNGGGANSGSGGSAGAGGNPWPDGGGALGGSGGSGASAGQGGTASGGSAGAGGSGGGCVPSCAGKQCGSDGCGSSCAPGCSANETCNGSGQCQATCSPTWYTALAGATVNGAVLSGQNLYAVGSKTAGGWVGRVDVCAGALAKESSVSPAGSQSSSLSKGIFAGGSLYVVGSVVTSADPRNGLYAKLNPTSLAASFVSPLYGSTGEDEVNAVAAATSGSLWMSGRSNSPTGPGWGIKGSTSGLACGFPLGTGAGSSFAAASSGNTIYVARTNAGQLYVDQFADASCLNTGPCPCTPTATSPAIALGTENTEARAMLQHAGAVYVAGFTYDTGTLPNSKAFVIRLNTAGQILGRYNFDPTTQFDGFVTLATDGTTLYAGGGQGWDQSATFASSTGMLHALPVGFGMNAVATWTRSFATLDVVGGVAAESGSGDGLYAAGLAAGGGFALRCTKNNLCPK